MMFGLTILPLSAQASGALDDRPGPSWPGMFRTRDDAGSGGQ